MRVAQVIPQGVNPYSGVLISTCRLAIELKSQGYDVELWHFRNLAADAEIVVRGVEQAGVPRVRLPRARLPAGLGALDREISRRRVDIVHLHGAFNWMNVRLANRLSVPYVVTPHGGYAKASLAHHAFRKEIYRRVFELPMLAGASAVGALTETEVDEIRRFGVTGEVASIPNGVDLPPLDVDPTAFRKEQGIPNGAHVASYIGRIDVRAKQLDAVVRGLVDAPDWYLVVVGGDYRNGVATMERLVRRAGISHRVRILPPRRGLRLHEVLAASDAFVLLSRSEGMPMALLEACSWGVAAIVSADVDHRLGVAAAGAGWSIDVAKLGEALHECGSQTAEDRIRRRASSAKFARSYSWNAVAQQYALLYERIVRERGEPRPAVDRGVATR